MICNKFILKQIHFLPRGSPHGYPVGSGRNYFQSCSGGMKNRFLVFGVRITSYRGRINIKIKIVEKKIFNFFSKFFKIPHRFQKIFFTRHVFSWDLRFMMNHTEFRFAKKTMWGVLREK